MIRGAGASGWVMRLQYFYVIDPYDSQDFLLTAFHVKGFNSFHITGEHSPSSVSCNVLSFHFALPKQTTVQSLPGLREAHCLTMSYLIQTEAQPWRHLSSTISNCQQMCLSDLPLSHRDTQHTISARKWSHELNGIVTILAVTDVM